MFRFATVSCPVSVEQKEGETITVPAVGGALAGSKEGARRRKHIILLVQQVPQMSKTQPREERDDFETHAHAPRARERSQVREGGGALLPFGFGCP